MPSVIVSKNSCKIEALYQWDVGQVLHIHGLTLPAAEVHFAHGTAGMAIVRTAEVGADGVISAGVPNVLLQEAKKINAYICTYEGEAFQSLYRIEIPVIARAKPSDYAGEVESEVYSLEALGVEVVTLKPGSDSTVEKVLNPDGTWSIRFSIPRGEDGKTPVKGKDYWNSSDKNEIVNLVLEALPSGGAGGGTGKRAVTIIIGSAESGHTADDCDYLCTGALDETLSDALRAINATGGEIRLLQGVYTLNGEALIRTNGVTISGCGGGTVLRGTGALVHTAASDFVVRDLTFDGCYVTAHGDVCEISHCRFVGRSYSPTYGALLKAPRVKVVGNYFENILVAVSIEDNASSCVISGNTLVDCNDGICDSSANNIIHDNSIVETTAGKVNTAIYAVGSNAYITDNVVNVSDEDAFPAEPFVVQGENNVHVNNFVNGALVETPSGGASSWNDLTDKPFGESFSDTLTWDGDTTGREVLQEMFVKMSDAAPTEDDLSNGFSFVFEGMATEVTPDAVANWMTVDPDLGAITISDGDTNIPIVVVLPTDIDGFGTRGTYFCDAQILGPGTFTSSFTIHGYAGFLTKVSLDEKFIPDTIQRTITGTPGDFVVIGEDGNVTTATLVNVSEEGA